MKLSTFTALAALCAVAESTSALPFPSDYRGAAAAAELQARTRSSSHKSSVGSSKPPTAPVTSRPSSSHPGSGSGSAGAIHPTVPSSAGSNTHSYPPSSGSPAHSAQNSGKPLAELPEPAEQFQPAGQVGTGFHSSADAYQGSTGGPPTSPNSNTGGKPQSAYETQSLLNAQKTYAQTQAQNAAINKHNGVMQTLGKVGAGIAGLGVAGGLGFGVWSAQETYNKDHPNQQQAQPAANQTANSTEQTPAQQTAQPVARRAIIDGEVYELYWVK